MTNMITKSQFQLLFKNSNDFICIINEKGKLIHRNKAFDNITGADIKIKSKPLIFNYFSPESAKILITRLKLFKKQSFDRIEIDIIDNEKNRYTADCSISLLNITKNNIKYLIIIKPIAEQNLLKIEEQLTNKPAQILASIQDLIFTFDKNGRFTYYTVPDDGLLYMKPENFIGKLCKEVMPEHISIKFDEAFNQNKDGKSAQYEYWIPLENSIKWYHATLSPIIENSKFNGSVAVVRDITPLKSIEKIIHIQQNLMIKLNTVNKLSKGIELCLTAVLEVCETDCGGIYLINKETNSLDLIHHKGISIEAIDNIANYFLNSSDKEELIKGHTLFKSIDTSKNSFINKSNFENMKALGIVPIRNANTVLGYLCVSSKQTNNFSDLSKDSLIVITSYMGNAIARLTVEEKLEDERSLIEAVLDTVGALIVVLDKTGKIVRFNHICEKVTKYKSKEVLGKYVWDLFLVPEEIEPVKLVFNNLKTGDFPNSYDNYWLSKNKKKHLIAWSNTAILNSKKQVEYIIGTGIDITQRKKNEEKIEKTLKEKDIMLKEIYHRVKNNLQIICSLLDLQTQNSTNNKVKSVFNESKNRIKTMALIHETLYHSENLTSININDYVNKLMSHLFISFGINSDKIAYNIYANNISMEISMAIYCGLIINELVSNSLKYAFINKDKGKISVIFELDKNIIKLIISDNGTGIPKEIKMDKVNTLGLTLVNTLVKHQLDGSIRILRKNGTKFTIKLKI